MSTPSAPLTPPRPATVHPVMHSERYTKIVDGYIQTWERRYYLGGTYCLNDEHWLISSTKEAQ